MKVSDWKGKDELGDIIKSPGKHLIVFAAKWCGFCSRFLSNAKSLESNLDAEIELIDADEPDESLWDQYSIKIVPTILVMKDGKQLFRRDGRSMAGLSESDLRQALDAISAV